MLMTYYLLHPEIAGELHEGTDPDGIESLHCDIDTWSGDGLLQIHRHFIVSAALATKLRNAALTGFSIRPVTITAKLTSAELALPTFSWLHITGRELEDDIGLSPMCDLVVSQSALSTLRETPLDNCPAEIYTD